MTDEELEAIKQRKLQELRRIAQPEKETGRTNANQVLNKIFTGRAWEVFNTATLQFPKAMEKIKETLVKLAIDGKLREVNGEQLFVLLRNIGLPVRIKTEIRFVGHGESKSLQKKLRES